MAGTDLWCRLAIPLGWPLPWLVWLAILDCARKWQPIAESGSRHTHRLRGRKEWSRQLSARERNILAPSKSIEHSLCLQRLGELAMAEPVVPQKNDGSAPSPSVRQVEIMECTLRDGSYAVDFKF